MAKRLMRLPKNSAHPGYSETHEENDWCPKAGCVPACTPSSPSSVDVEPDTEHGMSSEELAGRFGAHFKPAAPEAGVEAASPLHKESCVSQALDNGRFPVRDVAEAGVEVERELLDEAVTRWVDGPEDIEDFCKWLIGATRASRRDD